MINISHSFSNSNDKFNYLKKWLLDEYNQFDKGFYSNIEIIEKAFHNDKLITFDIDEVPVGLVVYNDCDGFIEIDILTIQYEYRNNGNGSMFYKLLENHFKKVNYLALKLYCNPPESETFWKKMGFNPFPENIYGLPELSYYKPLINTTIQSQNFNLKNKLELWDVEPHLAPSTNPKWCWEIKSLKQKLDNPIFHPANPNWNIRLTINGEILKEDKVKYFSMKNPIDIYPFLLIKNL